MLQAIADRNVRDIVTLSMRHGPDQPGRAIVVSDDQSPLAKILSTAYAAALPSARRVRFDATPRDELMAHFDSMTTGDLVVLIQSQSFRMEGFRIRVELLKRGMKVI